MTIYRNTGENISLFNTEDKFQEIVINSINDLHYFLSIPHNTYSFRGQSNYEWGLKTSFERFLENKDIKISIENMA